MLPSGSCTAFAAKKVKYREDVLFIEPMNMLPPVAVETSIVPLSPKDTFRMETFESLLFKIQS
jgi:hypothetical protein